MLKARFSLQPVRNTSLIEIKFSSENPREAADIANAITRSYRNYRLNERARKISETVRVLEQAYSENNAKIGSIQTEMFELSREQTAQSTNRLDEAKRKIDDLQRFGQGLFTKLATEKTDLSLPATSMVQILDEAVPGFRPVRPNKPLNIAIGIIVGVGAGLFLATFVYGLQRSAFRRKSGEPRTEFPPRFRAIVHVLIALVVGIIVGYYCAAPFEYSTIIVIPLAVLLGGVASAYIELANPRPIPEPAATPGGS